MSHNITARELPMSQSQEDFEGWVQQYAKDVNYQYPNNVLKKHEDGSYAVTWVDSAWIGWQARENYSQAN